MAITQIDPTLGAGSEYDLEAVSVWANTNAFGRDRCSLTEWDTTTVPALAEGSIFETGGAYYQVDSDTAITVGAVSDGFVFILVNTTVPAVPTLQFTNSIPVWDAAKFGYYDTVTTYKALPFRIYKSSTSYSMKELCDLEFRILTKPYAVTQAYRSTDYTFSGAFTPTSHEISTFWDGTNYNLDSALNTTTGRFTPPYEGIYSFHYTGKISCTGASDYIEFGLMKNGTDLIDGQVIVTTSGTPYYSYPPKISNVYLKTSDYVSIYYRYTASGATWKRVSLPGVTDYNNIILNCYRIG